MSISKVILLLTAAMMMSCSNKPHRAEANSAAKTSAATARVGGSHYTVVEFDKQSAALSSDSREALAKLTNTANAQGRKIDEIKVLAWADREYPVTGSKAGKPDVKLAEQRADNIKNYLKNELAADVDVDEHNMAERPSVFSELIQTDDYKIKTTFENTGAAPVAKTDLRALLDDNKASKAVIFIKYE